MLRELILKELSNREPVTLTKDVLEGVVNYVQESIDWCVSTFNPRLCMDFLKVVRDITSSLPAVRLRKFISLRDNLSREFMESSVDYSVLNHATALIRRFLELSFLGLVSGGKVAARFKEYVMLGGREFPRGATVLIDATEALMLELMGCVEIVGRIS